MNQETDLSPAIQQLIDTHFSGLRRIVRKNLPSAGSYKCIVMRRNHASTWRRCPRKFGRGLTVGFCPVEGRIPSFEGWHRGLLKLGCRTAEFRHS